jgi:RHS repeat-associated protein
MTRVGAQLSTDLPVSRSAITSESNATARQATAPLRRTSNRDLMEEKTRKQNQKPRVFGRFLAAVVSLALPIALSLFFSPAARGNNVSILFRGADGNFYLTGKEACLTASVYAGGLFSYQEPPVPDTAGSCVGPPTSLGVQNGYNPTTLYDWYGLGIACPQGYSIGVTGGYQYCSNWPAPPPLVIPEKNQGICCKGTVTAGNPVNPGVGNKIQIETDYRSSSLPLEFTRTYNSWRGITQPFNRWQSTYDRSVVFDPTGYPGALVFRPDGTVLYFNIVGTQFVPDSDVDAKLQRFVDGSGNTTGWQYTTSHDDLEVYNAAGVLTSITSRTGVIQTLVYSDSQTPFQTAPTPNLLLSVTDSFGHQLQFTYDTQSRLHTMTDPAGSVYTYNFDSNNNLTSVNYPDGSVRTYVYNESANTSGANLPTALTGIIDESNQRFATFQYDTLGRAISTEHAGGAEKVSFVYTTDANGNILTSNVTDALSTTRTYSFANVLGVVKSAAISQPCSNCGAGAATTYDANGNIATLTDFNGNVTTYVYDLTRNLETSRTEASGTAQARTITTVWDANWRQPDLITEPNRTTAFTYDSLGNVLTKTITDTTVTPNISRIWTYTYDIYGRMLTAKGPRTDVNSTTTYAYYTCTTGVQCGEVEAITDAAGHVTTFNTYNAHGQPLTITDANGVVTTLTYDSRQRLTSRQAGTETTSYSYYPTGLLNTITLPDGSTLASTYDAAHRLTGVTDGLGDHIDYTLDAMGNHTTENTFDPSNTLRRTHSRVINTLNQLYQDINAAGTAAVTTTFGYDNEGNQISIAAPLSRNTANQYDALNRLTQVTDPNSGVTQFGYDANDNLTSVKDPRSLTTTYSHSGFGDVIQQVSPDTGTTTNTYDSGGNLKTATDARGAVATYSYDALNRVTQVAYSDQTIAYTYDAGTNGVGRLTGASDANHSMAWTYDSLGRITGKSQIVAGITKSVGYSYNNGDLTSLVTPSGQIITYAYTNHRITSIAVNGVALLSGVTYSPFGPITGWTWGNGTTVSRTYDEDGNPSQIVTAGDTHNYTVDNASRITGITDSTLPGYSWTFGYDSLDRVVSGQGNLTRGYSYDTNGNRLTSTGTVAYTATNSTTNNQLNSTSGGLARTYTYDAAGNTTSFTGYTFTYNGRGRMGSVNVSASVGVSGGGTTYYVYNALGPLIEKSGYAGTTLIMYDEWRHVLGEYSSTGALVTETIWMGDLPVAALQPSGSTVAVYYIHTDHLGNPRKITQSSDNGLRYLWDPDTFSGVAPNYNPAGLGTFTYNLRFPGQYRLVETGLASNYFRDYDPATGRYLESDPIGQLFYFNISNTPGVSQLHRGYWNKLYTYVDDDPVKLKDPTGLGRFDWLWDLFKEKTPEEITTKGLAAGFGAQCIAQNCGKSRDPIDLYGDCVSILNDWVKKMGTGAMGAINGITGDGGEGVVSDCAELCEKGISSGSCCNKGQKQ